MRINLNSAFHKFTIQKWLGCINITGMASLLRIKTCPREMFYTWCLHEIHTKWSQKNNSALRNESQMWQAPVNAACHSIICHSTDRELKIWSLGGLLVRFLRLQAKLWKSKVLPLWKSPQFLCCQTKWNRIYIKPLKKKKRHYYWEKKYPTDPILCFVKEVQRESTLSLNPYLQQT